MRWAIEQADGAGGTDIINFSPTVFNTPETITFGESLGPIAMTGTGLNITIDGPGVGLLTVNGNNNGAVLEVDSGVTATISGLTVSGGSIGGSGAISNLGSLTLSNCSFTADLISPVYDAGTASISDCTISSNQGFFGGGVYTSATGTVTITDVTFSGNTSVSGGGIWNAGTTTITDCSISGTLDNGGGLYNSGHLTVTNCTISGDSGPGLFNAAGTAYLSGSTISGNSYGGQGGNLVNRSGATLIVTGCTISNGSAGAGGGLTNDGTATLTDCTVSNNTSEGIFNGSPTSVLVLTESTLVGNTATAGGNEDGAGLWNEGTATLTDDTITGNVASSGTGGGVRNDGNATLIACTVTGNTAMNAGGGIYQHGFGPNNLTLDDTIVAGNISTMGGSAVANDIVVNNPNLLPIVASYNLIGPGGSGGLTNGTDGNIVLTTLTGLNLASLGDYGGPTETIALELTSVAIGAGSSTIAGVTVPNTDQRGLPRNTHGFDIGDLPGIGIAGGRGYHR